MGKTSLAGLSSQAYQSLNAEILDIEERIFAIGNLIGPAYGAPWCDKAAKLRHQIGSLRRLIEDQHLSRDAV